MGGNEGAFGRAQALCRQLSAGREASLGRGRYRRFAVRAVDAPSRAPASVQPVLVKATLLVVVLAGLAGLLLPSTTFAAESRYAKEVLADSPLVYYRLDETTGSIAFDSSGHGQNGAYESSTVLGVSGALDGDPDGAISTSGVALTASAATLPSGQAERTLEVWFKSQGGGGVISYGNFVVALDNCCAVSINDAAEYRTVSVPDWRDGAWHLLDVTTQGTTATVYVDGQQWGSVILPNLSTTVASPFALGQSDVNFGTFSGSLDEAAVYGKALSPERIEAHWTRGASKSATVCAAAPTSPYSEAVLADSPITYFRLDDIAADSTDRVAFDSSGNCNNGAYSPTTASQSEGATLDGDAGISTGGGYPVSQSGASLPAGQTARTLEVWFKSGAGGGVIGYGNFYISLDNCCSVSVDDGLSSPAVGVPDWRDGAWHLLDVTTQGTTATVYVDGQEWGTASLPNLNTTLGSPLLLGGFNVGPGTFSGSLDEAAVYGKALSPERIEAHWTRGASKSATVCAAAPTSPYSEAVLADSPITYFRLDDIAADSTDRVAFDSSGNCNNGAYSPTTASQSEGATLDGDAGISTGGGYPVSQSGASLPAGQTARTLEVWFKSGAGGGVIGYGNFYISLDNCCSVSVDDGLSSPAVGVPDWRDGAWHLLDVTTQGTTATVYVDGQEWGTASLPNLNTTLGSPLLLGGFNVGPGTFSGSLDEAAVYGKALSPERIEAHWTRGASKSATVCAAAPTSPYSEAVLADSPITYFRLDDIAADSTDRVAFDSSGNCNNGAYSPTTASQSEGATLDGDAGISTGGGYPVSQSGASLPAGQTARTLEVWFKSGAGGGVIGYGNFYISLDNCCSVSVDDGLSSPAVGVPDWRDGAWHLLDVTTQGTTATVYVDGQEWGTASLPNLNTTLGSPLLLGGFNVGPGTFSGSLDEAAVYGKALSPERIEAHWKAQFYAPPGEDTIAGTVTLSGSPLANAVVEACPTAGGTCVVAPARTYGDGSFKLAVAPGSYAVTALPPPGNTAQASLTVGPVTVPPSNLNVAIKFTPPGALPPTVSFNGQTETEPVVNWGQPSTITAKGCAGGLGVAYVGGTNTSTGQHEYRAATLVETPEGSGNYVGQLPPLAPIHGEAALDPMITCPGHSEILPNGGPPGGGTPVILTGSGFTGATGVTFGSTPAESFEVLTDGIIKAVAPAGTGTVLVTVTSASDTTLSVGGFDYFDATSLSATSGPEAGGNTITIHGHGFNSVRGVLFGLLPSSSVTVVNENEIKAEAPVGIGTVDVQVLNGFAISQPSQATLYTYEGGPPGSGGINEGTAGGAGGIAGGDAGAAGLAQEISTVCADGDCPGAVSQAADYYDSPPPDSGDDTEKSVEGWLNGFATVAGVGFGLACATPEPAEPAACFIAGTIWAGVGLGTWLYDQYQEEHLCIRVLGAALGFGCGIKVDPSGAVVDTTGNPIPGATTTILDEPGGTGPFEAVAPESGVIDPSTNPETTSTGGEFDWDATAGTYQIEATAKGCNAPGNPFQPSVVTQPFTLPPPVTGLVLTLECPGSIAPSPVVTSLTEESGPTTGGTQLDIIGSGLAAATGVSFGGTPAKSFAVLSPSAILAVAPPGTSTVDVRVEAPGGKSATSAADHFTYLTAPSSPSAPTVTGISPDAGPLQGGDTVTISGTHLVGVLAVHFGTATASAITPLTSETLRATVPAAIVDGPVDVTVQTEQGGSPIDAGDQYTYGASSGLSEPAVTEQPVTVKVKAGEAASFTAAASGDPVPTVQWQVSKGGAAFTNVVGATSDTFTISAAAISESGDRYQAVFTNSQGDATSEPATLTVAPALSVATEAAAEVGQTSAILNASINPYGSGLGACYFEYGTTLAYGATVACGSEAVLASGVLAASATVTGLSPGSAYYYRIVATNSAGTAYGAAQTFTTQPPTPPRQQDQATTKLCPSTNTKPRQASRPHWPTQSCPQRGPERSA